MNVRSFARPAAVLSLAAAAVAQNLVADLATGAVAAGSNPIGFVAAGGKAFFAASTPGAGAEPCVTDGTAAGTRRIVDLAPGADHSAAAALCAIAPGEGLFRVYLPGVGQQLLRSNGSASGTQLLGTLGIPVGLDEELRAVQLPNGRLIVSRRPIGLGTAQSFATDLTVAGTVAIPGLHGFDLLLEDGGFAYGVSADGFLWRTDGTVAGSVQLAAGAYLLPERGRAPTATHWQGRVWFLRTLGQGLDLWSTDGTPAGTRFELTVSGVAVTTQVHGPFALGSRLAWVSFGVLWTSDGTQAGSQLVANLPCNSLSSPQMFGGRLYFGAAGGNTGGELWSTDGTAAGTTLVADAAPGPGNSAPRGLTVSGGNLFLVQAIGGTSQLAVCTGPQSLQTLGPIPISPYAERPVPFAGGVLFAAAGNQVGEEPWFASATQPPAPIVDLNTELAGLATDLAARGRDRLFFGGYDTAHGGELWSSDGTAAGTRVVDLTPGASTTVQTVHQIVPFGDRVAASVTVSGPIGPESKVLVSDGTVAGSVLLPGGPTGPLAPFRIAVRGDQLYCGALGQSQLLVSDGTVAGTAALSIGSTFGFRDLHVLPTRVVFDDEYSTGVRGSDGIVTEFLSVGSGRILGRVGERVVFWDSRGVLATDGTVLGTALLQANMFLPWHVAEAADRLVFAVSNEIFATDGTAVGTRRLAVLPFGLQLEQVLAGATATFVVATDAVHGRELWRLDVASGSASLVEDLAPGWISGVQRAWLCGDGDLLFVAATDGSDGSEPYVSDGTAAGTRRLADVFPGADSSNPVFLGIAGRRVFFRADDGVVGAELWQASLDVVGAASLQRVAGGCPGVFGVPEFATNSAPQLGNGLFAFRLGKARGASLAVAVVGTELGDSSLFGCRFAPAGVAVNLLGATTIGGEASFAVPLPNSPAFVGVALTAQGFVFDSAAAHGFAGSNGVFVAVGR